MLFNFLHTDVDSKLPEKLKIKFVHVRPDERYSALICILKYIVAEDAQTVVFVGTQHHVELVSYVKYSVFLTLFIRALAHVQFVLIVIFIYYSSVTKRSRNFKYCGIFKYGSIST